MLFVPSWVANHTYGNYGCQAVEILGSARKHGITDDEMRHAIANAITTTSAPTRPDVEMIIGPDVNGRLLEIGIIETDDGSYVIHAMPARASFLRGLGR